jgi:hypothetical protein
MRHEGLIQVFFAGQLSDKEIIEMLERSAEKLRMLLAGYAQVPEESAECRELVESPREEFFWMLTLDWGIHSARSQLEWLEGIIQRIRDKQHPAN